MPFNSGTGITDHIDMLDKLTEVVTSRYLESVAVNSGGTGHAVGDIIQITATGSTSTIVAQLEVTSVSSGVIDGIRVYRSGAYTVDPTTTTGNAQSATSGSGISATFDLTFTAAKWSVNRRTQEAASAVVGTAGNGYNIGDVLTVVDGAAVHGDADATGTAGTAATFTVATLTGGAGSGVATVTLTSAGNYEEVPANDAATTNDGSGDDACELTITWQDATKANTDFQVCMLEGEGSAGTDEIHVMIKAFSLANGFDTAFNWALMGATAYNSSLPIHQQVGVNADQINTTSGALPADGGCYMVLKDDDADPDISWWINWTGRRIILVAKVESGSTTQYMSCYMGLLNQFGTDSEYPYPLAVISGTNTKNRTWFDTSELTGGIIESICNQTGDPTGPGYIRQPAGTWLPFCAEGSSNGGIRNLEAEFGVYPFINPATLTNEEQTVSTGSNVDFAGGIIPATSVPGSPTVQLKPTPGTGDSYYWLVTPLVMRMEDTAGNPYPDFYNLYGEIAGAFWFSTGNTAVVSEDRFELDTKRYSIFQNGNRTQVWSYFALDED